MSVLINSQPLTISQQQHSRHTLSHSHTAVFHGRLCETAHAAARCSPAERPHRLICASRSRSVNGAATGRGTRCGGTVAFTPPAARRVHRGGLGAALAFGPAIVPSLTRGDAPSRKISTEPCREMCTRAPWPWPLLLLSLPLPAVGGGVNVAAPRDGGGGEG